jgi:putative phosphoribosyl transferase
MQPLKGTREEGYIQITAAGVTLHGNLLIPARPRGLVVFAHGSGSSRYSPRNQYVAEALRRSGLATLLFDLLTLDEEAEDSITGKQRFDIPLLARRLAGVTDWLRTNDKTRPLRIGYFGASTGAAAALVAAAEKADVVGAVVSRGGRPDLAGQVLDKVKAPTLLIVGGLDNTVINMNRWALVGLKVEKDMVIVPGAGHLFEEPGALEQVASLAGGWFLKHLAGTTSP